MTTKGKMEFPIKIFKKLSSTQIKTKEFIEKGADPWTVILAREQTSGHGREGALWYSPPGGLYFSVILPKSKIEDLQTLTILAAFIVAKVIKEKFKLEPLIKLPNDVLLGSKKICGILTENIIGQEVKFSVMGIGLNTNIREFPPDLKKIATSLKIELGREVNNQEILVEIIKELKEQLKTISE